MKKKFLVFTVRTLKVLLAILIALFLIPNNTISPIANEDFIRIDPGSFWQFPWGESGVHKGIDVFCKTDAKAVAPIYGIIVKKGYGSISGNYVYLLGPKLRLYYFAHLDSSFVSTLQFVSKGDKIGRAGNTGNAFGKPVHLHFSIETIVPYPWLKDETSVQGHLKMYYLDPNKLIAFPNRSLRSS